MFDFIPVEYYTPLFYNIILLLVLFTVIKLITTGYIILNPLKKEYTSLPLFLIVTLYIGLRPIHEIFPDMPGYNYFFELFAAGGEVMERRDLLWNYFIKFCSGFMNAHSFFLVCAFLYVTPIYVACKKWLGRDHYFLLLMFIASFSFWAAGTNGIRNGIATSLFILGISFTKNKYMQYIVITISFFIHGSMIIPISAYILSFFYKNSKYYLMGWLVAIALSLLLGGFWENFITSLGYEDNRLQYLTMEGFDDQFSSIGFRWDFLLYSSSAIFAGYYFIIKKKFNDTIYIQLFNIYVTANAFWILVIRASFSNRFAYLSWFLMAVIIFYPFFKKQFFKKQQKVLAYSILIYFGFTYFMFLIK